MTAKEIIDLRDHLKANRAPMLTHWDELSELYMPFRTIDATGKPDLFTAEETYDTTARRAALILANGLASLVCPREEIWFEYQPPFALRGNDEATRFYRKVSEIVREMLESSNFYEEIQECLIESPVFGTTSLFIGEMDDDGLYFLNQPIKTYYISEDHRHRVNCFIRDLHYTAQQAADEYGEDKLPLEVKEKLGHPDGKTETFEFIHIVYPNKDKQGKPYLTQVIHEKTQTVVSSSQYEEFPFAVHRYRRHGRCVWGFGPGAIAKGDPRQVNFLNQMIDAGTEKAVFPPVVAPNTLEGEIGLGALEITYVDPTDPNSASMLREWAPAGRLDIANARLADKRQQIEQAFHVDLFQMFASRQGSQPLSATEANYLSGEKLSQFSPVFGRLVSEMLDPILKRLFGLIIRNNMITEIPDAVTTVIGGKRRGIAFPAVLYKNRIMLAMQARQNGSLMDYMNLASPLLQVYPEAADVLNFPNIVRDTSRNAGLPEDWIQSKDAVAKIQQDRAAAQQQQQEMMMAQGAAEVAATIGKAPADVRAKAGM